MVPAELHFVRRARDVQRHARLAVRVPAPAGEVARVRHGTGVLGAEGHADGVEGEERGRLGLAGLVGAPANKRGVCRVGVDQARVVEAGLEHGWRCWRCVCFVC